MLPGIEPSVDHQYTGLWKESATPRVPLGPIKLIIIIIIIMTMMMMMMMMMMMIVIASYDNEEI